MILFLPILASFLTLGISLHPILSLSPSPCALSLLLLSTAISRTSGKGNVLTAHA